MGRLGVSLGSWADFLGELKRYENIDVEGILSHFSMSDEDGGTFSSEQWEKFKRSLKAAEEQGIQFKYFHIANSGNLHGLPLLFWESRPTRDYALWFLPLLVSTRGD